MVFLQKQTNISVVGVLRGGRVIEYYSLGSLQSVIVILGTIE